MFSAILRQYDDLIREMDRIDFSMIIKRFYAINSNRIVLFEELKMQNKKASDERAQHHVREFIATDEADDFFEKIADI